MDMDKVLVAHTLHPASLASIELIQHFGSNYMYTTQYVRKQVATYYYTRFQ